MLKYAEPELARSYVGLVRSRSKAKMIAATEVVERTASYTFKCAIVTATLQERKEQFQVKELECSELQSKLAVEKNLCTQKELECKDLRVNISNAHKVQWNFGTNWNGLG